MIAMIYDFFILTPVLAFLLWLFWYSAPAERCKRQGVIDSVIAAIGLGGSLLVLYAVHAGLDASVEGLNRNVIAVASSYLFLVAVLGVGWIRRFWRITTKAPSP